MWVDWPMWAVGLVNALGIPAVHLGISWVFTRLPADWFTPRAWWARPVPGESAAGHERVFRVSRWKGLLPDAAPWFGGFAKRSLRAGDREYLERFVVETCRGELAHHAQVVAIAGFGVWTPWPWTWVIWVYAVASNLPCILVQRSNRLRMMGLLARIDKAVCLAGESP